MKTNSKVYLTISLVLMPMGIVALMSDVGTTHPTLYAMFPVGAVFFGLFLVTSFLGKEAAQFTKEQHENEQVLEELSRKA